MADRPSQKAFQEFLSEAQEIVETFSRDLLALDAERASGRFDPEVINDAFRAVHSLKGLSGLFNVTAMSTLSHNLENLLDSLRLGRVQVTPALLDLMFEAVEMYGRLLAEAAEGKKSDVAPVKEFLGRVDAAAAADSGEAASDEVDDYDIDGGTLSVLTEYEEHRLKENLRQGRRLHRIHASFDLLEIDKGLEDLKARLKPVGEVITYLPNPETADPSRIELDVLLGSDASLGDIKKALKGTEATVQQIPRKKRSEATRGREPAARAAVEVEVQAEPILEAEPPARPSTPPEEADKPATLKSVSQTVRVDIRKLDHLMNVVGELALARAGITQVLDALRATPGAADLARRLHREVRSLERKLDEMQNGILEVRMVPLGQMFDKLSRVVRKISRDAGKEIRFVIRGAETELDKLIVEELSDPLMHIIRNAIDHGIEDVETRRELGKPDAGTVSVSATQKGNHVVIEIADDGAGFDEDGILRTALARGLIDARAARDLSRRDLLNLVFLPGFSTRDEATEISGRGVGMDVVKTNIARLSGIIDIASTPGRGTTMTVTLPITLAIIPALVIRVAGRTYAVPLNSVLESLTVEPQEIQTIEGREVIDLRGQTLALARLDQVFGLARETTSPSDKLFVVVVGLAQHRLGLVVDELQGQQDIVIKSLGRALSGVIGIAGATELGGQQTVLVLDVAALVEESLSVGAEAA